MPAEGLSSFELQQSTSLTRFPGPAPLSLKSSEKPKLSLLKSSALQLSQPSNLPLDPPPSPDRHAGPAATSSERSISGHQPPSPKNSTHLSGTSSLPKNPISPANSSSRVDMTAAGDRITFTLESPHMRDYISTMSAAGQEAFAIRIAQAHGRRKMREARQTLEAARAE
ncbi:hypothetical protein AN958_10644 [Leucoagaricus sp. SymC.cos]|nr:hypothetical protein AN958_10644 [Leucoagaricus sp. SymC.cos]